MLASNFYLVEYLPLPEEEIIIDLWMIFIKFKKFDIAIK